MDLTQPKHRVENEPEYEDFHWSRIRDVYIHHQLAWCIWNTMDLLDRFLRNGLKSIFKKLIANKNWRLSCPIRERDFKSLPSCLSPSAPKSRAKKSASGDSRFLSFGTLAATRVTFFQILGPFRVILCHFRDILWFSWPKILKSVPKMVRSSYSLIQ